MDMPGIARRLAHLPAQGISLAAAAPQQVAALWSEVETLLHRVRLVLDRVELLVASGQRTLEEVDGLLDSVERIAGRAAGVVGEADLVSGRADAVLGAVAGTERLSLEQVRRVRELLDLYSPVLQRFAPLAEHLSADLKTSQLIGIRALLDVLPDVVDRIEPALKGMAALMPEIEEVAERMDSVGQVVEGLPGAKMLRRRGQARGEDAD